MESYQHQSIQEKSEAASPVVEDAASSDTSSSTQFTPKTGFTFGHQAFEAFGHAPSAFGTSLGEVPWYDKTYMILDKHTRKAITLSKEDGISLSLQACEDGPNAWNSWLCVCKNNYTAFLSQRSRRYLGHDGKELGGKLHSVALKLDEWEYFIPRPYPEGGYQLLSPFWAKHMMLLVKTSEGEIQRAHHGDTLWVFEEVGLKLRHVMNGLVSKSTSQCDSWTDIQRYCSSVDEGGASWKLKGSAFDDCSGTATQR